MAQHLTPEEIRALPLFERAVAAEERRHRSRMAELNAAAGAIKLLGVQHAAIKAAGYEIECDDIVYLGFPKRGIHLTTPSREESLLLALVKVGFKVAFPEPEDKRQIVTATFTKGNLVLTSLFRTEVLARFCTGAITEQVEHV